MPQRAADKFADGITTHTVNILRVAEGERENVITELEKLSAVLVVEVEKAAGKSAMTQARVAALKKQTDETIADAYAKIAKANGKTLAGVAQLEAKHAVKLTNTVIGVPVATVAMSTEQLTAMAGKTLIHGKFAGEWWRKQGAELQDKFSQQMRVGMALGEGVDKLVDRVRGKKANNYADGIMMVSKRQAEALVRTGVIAVSNEARLATFANNDDLIKGVAWLATLDNRTTSICKALDGKEWRLPDYEPIGHDKAFPGPTAHWNCRSTQTAVLRSWEELAGPKANLKALAAEADPKSLNEALKENLIKNQGMSLEQALKAVADQRASMDGGAPTAFTFQDWLKGKSDEFQDAVLGPARAKLWRDGKIDITDLTDQQNRPLSLAQLHELVTGEKPTKEFTADFLALSKKPDPFIDTEALAAAQAAQAAAKLAQAEAEAQAAQAQEEADKAAIAQRQADAEATAQRQAALKAIAAKEAAEEAAAKAEAALKAQQEAEAKLQAVAAKEIADAKANPEGKQLLAKALKAIAAEQPGLKPTELLAAAKEQAKAQQAKNTLTANLSQYKKAVLAGKKPTPSQVAAVASLDDEAALAFLNGIDEIQLAAKEAAKLAQEAAEKEAKAIAEAAALKAAKDKANAEAQAQIGAILANPEGQQLKAKALGKLMVSNPELEPAELLAKAYEEASLAQKKASDSATLSAAKKKLLAGEVPTPAQGKVINEMTPEAKKAWLDGIQAEKFKAQAAAADVAAAKAGKDAAAATQAAQAVPLEGTVPAVPPKPAPVKTPINTPIPETPPAAPSIAPVNETAFPATPSAMVNVKGLGGSTGAKLVSDPATGELYVYKTGSNVGHIREEMTADRAYAIIGAPVPEGRLYETAAGPVKLTRYLGNDAQSLQAFLAKASPAEAQAMREQLRGYFAMDALLANYDVAGASLDNILVSKGVAYRVDNGGSLRYRAMGALKTDFHGKVTELDSLLDSKINANTAGLFKGITEKEIKAQVENIVAKREEILALMPEEIRDTVAARIKYMADRYKVPMSSANEPGPVGFDKMIGEKIRKARINGVSILGDGGDVEDLHILAWEETGLNGTPATRLQMKLTLAGAKRLSETVGPDKINAAVAMPGAVGVVSNVHPQDSFWNSILQGAKTVSAHAGDGNYNVSTLATMQATKQKLAAMAVDKSLDAEGNKMVAEYLAAIAKIEEAQAAKKPLPPGSLKQFVYVPPKAVAAPVKIEGNYKVAKGDLVFEQKQIENGKAKVVAGQSFNGGSGLNTVHFEFADGIKVRYVPPTGTVNTQTGLALQGTVDLTIPAAASPEAMQRAYDAMKALGIDVTPPGPEVQEMVYLQRGAYLLNKSKPDTGLVAIVEGQGTPQERLQAARAYVSTKYKAKLSGPEYKPEGSPNSFGEGHRSWMRWDLPASQVEKEMPTHALYHRTSGSIVDVLDALLNSGGEATPTVQRIRKGINISSTGGMSASTDIQTGGASYFFTRIMDKAKGTYSTADGLRFKIRNLARLDAVSYADDKFGRIDSLSERKTTIAQYKAISGVGGNETIFKNGLNLLDEIDSIKTTGETQRAQVIAVFKKHGITVLPDGRSVESIVLK